MKGGRYSMVERFMVARSMLRPYAESPLFEQRRSTPSHRPISPPGMGPSPLPKKSSKGPSPLPKKSSRGRFNPSIGRPRKCGSYLIVSLEITNQLGEGMPLQSCSRSSSIWQPATRIPNSSLVPPRRVHFSDFPLP